MKALIRLAFLSLFLTVALMGCTYQECVRNHDELVNEPYQQCLIYTTTSTQSKNSSFRSYSTYCSAYMTSYHMVIEPVCDQYVTKTS